MNDRIQNWLTAKKALDATAEYDPSYEDEERCTLVEEAQKIFEELMKN